MPSTRKVVFIAAAVGALALAAGYGSALWLRPPPPTPDNASQAPVDFTLTDIAGRERRLSEWRGRPIVINFWATWCAPCREEIPLFVDAQQRYRAHGLQIVGIALDQPADAAQFAAKFGISYPTLIADTQTLDLMNRYGNPVGSLPYTVMLRADGVVVHRKLGAFRPAELDQALSAAVR